MKEVGRRGESCWLREEMVVPVQDGIASQRSRVVDFNYRPRDGSRDVTKASQRRLWRERLTLPHSIRRPLDEQTRHPRRTSSKWRPLTFSLISF